MTARDAPAVRGGGIRRVLGWWFDPPAQEVDPRRTYEYHMQPVQMSRAIRARHQLPRVSDRERL